MSSLRRRLIVLGTAGGLLLVAVSLMVSGAIGSEFLPHLDEGAIWARGTLAPSTGPAEGERVMKQARLMFASFPEVTQVVSQVGRPDDGTDPRCSRIQNTSSILSRKHSGAPSFMRTKRN